MSGVPRRTERFVEELEVRQARMRRAFAVVEAAIADRRVEEHEYAAVLVALAEVAADKAATVTEGAVIDGHLAYVGHHLRVLEFTGPLERRRRELAADEARLAGLIPFPCRGDGDDEPGGPAVGKAA